MTTTVTVTPTATGAAAEKPAPPPTGLQIPDIGLSTPLMSLGLRSDGTIAVPPLRSDSPPGWYRNGGTPGDTGAAVIVGHVDTAWDGPAVFYRLRELKPGATIQVRRQDGSTAAFTVTKTAWYRKSAFPTTAVYGPTPTPELRLITCGGSFDRLRRTYRENLVVYATLLSIIEPTESRATAQQRGRIVADLF